MGRKVRVWKLEVLRKGSLETWGLLAKDQTWGPEHQLHFHLVYSMPSRLFKSSGHSYLSLWDSVHLWPESLGEETGLWGPEGGTSKVLLWFLLLESPHHLVLIHAQYLKLQICPLGSQISLPSKALTRLQTLNLLFEPEVPQAHLCCPLFHHDLTPIPFLTDNTLEVSLQSLLFPYLHC